jgi:serine/threonine protein kinase
VNAGISRFAIIGALITYETVPLPSPPPPRLVSGGQEAERSRTTTGIEQPVVRRGTGVCVTRARNYSFVLDEAGHPVELGSGRFAKTYLGEEAWVESKTTFRRKIAIKILQKGVSVEDQLRFQLEKQILEHVQSHPNVVELLASGESDNPGFVPAALRDRVENDFLILELLDMSLEERLKGTRHRRQREDLLALSPSERLLRVLDYIVPVATAVEYSHLVRDTCHRDIKPANILIKLPDPNLEGSPLQVKLADFNTGKAKVPDTDISVTRFRNVPGTIYFQSPEQETNSFELLVNVASGSNEVEYFEDFYIDVCENDVFSIYNRSEVYTVASADRARKRLILTMPFAETTEHNVRAKVTKAVGRPADIYSLGALFYYLVSGAYGNPKSLYDSFRKFIEYERKDKSNTVRAYVEHEYGIIQNLRAPKNEEERVEVAPEDRFFSYKQYLDGGGDLIDKEVMYILARAMIRNKPDSYCMSWDLQTTGISAMVRDLMGLYVRFGVNPSARGAYQRLGLLAARRSWFKRGWENVSSRVRTWKRR